MSKDCSYTNGARTERSYWPLPPLGKWSSAAPKVGLSVFLLKDRYLSFTLKSPVLTLGTELQYWIKLGSVPIKNVPGHKSLAVFYLLWTASHLYWKYWREMLAFPRTGIVILFQEPINNIWIPLSIMNTSKDFTHTKCSRIEGSSWPLPPLGVVSSAGQGKGELGNVRKGNWWAGMERQWRGKKDKVEQGSSRQGKETVGKARHDRGKQGKASDEQA